MVPTELPPKTIGARQVQLLAAPKPQKRENKQ